MADSWYYKMNGKEQGPFTDDELKSHAASGKIQSGTPVRQGHSANGKWVSAGNFKGPLPTPASTPPQPSGSQTGGNRKATSKADAEARESDAENRKEFRALRKYADICFTVASFCIVVVMLCGLGSVIGFIEGQGFAGPLLGSAVFLALNCMLLFALSEGIRAFIRLVDDTRQSKEALHELVELTRGP
jgi:hypothetical protein